MKPNNLTKALGYLWDANVPVIVWGDAGIGKSQIIQQVGRNKGVPVVDLRLATQEVGDLIGIPYHEQGQTKWGKPSWWLEQPEWYLFLDEVNRAPKEVVQAIFQLVLDRRLATHKLPSGVRIVAACNPPEGDYVTDSLDPALNTRFCHIRLDADAEQWVDNCSDFIDETVLGYIASAPNQLLDLDSQFDLQTVARRTPRTWEYAGKIYKSMQEDINAPEGRAMLQTLLTGTIGPAAAVDYVRSLDKSWTKPIDIVKGVKTYEDVRKDPTDLKRLCMILPVSLPEDSLRKEDGTLNTGYRDNLQKFLESLVNDHDDLGIAVLRRLSKSGSVHRDVRRAISKSRALFETMRRLHFDG
tara:strand:+ start:3093 stop:4157 length:1065 start_codon:yes stop_codon:yes gene_type:complete